MTCGSCVARVERALRGVSGVRDARVNLTTELATVDFESASADVNALIHAVRDAGYDADRRHGQDADAALEQSQATKLRQQRQAVVQAVGLAIPIIGLELIGPVLQSSLPGGYVWWRVLQGLLTAMLLVSPAGGPILAGGLRAIIHRSPNMDLLISLGVSAAFVSSAVSIFLPGANAFHFHAAAMILAFINLGKHFELRARREAAGAVSALARRMPKTALRIVDGNVESIPVGQVQMGDRIRVPEDSIVPVDGRIVEGSAGVDESAVTGESTPVARRVGDDLPAGVLVREGNITIEPTRLGSQSTMAAIVQAVEHAQTSKTRLQRLADRVAGVFVPVVVGLALLTFAGWFLTDHGLNHALSAAIAVVVISCPCAMGLATPTAVLVATGNAALRGILVRDAASLEATGRADVVVFDKTGTLTTGEPTVEQIATVNDGSNDDESVLRIAAGAEQFSRHPFAVAMLREAKERGLTLASPSEFDSEPGFGVRATIDGRAILAGSESFLGKHDVDVGAARDRLDAAERDGANVVLVAFDARLAGWILFRDTIRPDAKSAIDDLHAMGIKTAMVTGDRKVVARAVAESLGIDDVIADVRPEQKLENIGERRNQGKIVVFVGDGINDAPALAAADVGIAFAAGTDVAAAAADITLMGDDLIQIPSGVQMARRTVRVIKQNLFWAFFYNLAAIPLAATGHVPPGVAAAAMMVSSITVVLNSLRLRNRVASKRALSA